MVQNFRRIVALAAAGIFVCGSAVAGEEKRTEEIRIERVAAKQALVALRVMAGAGEIEVVDPHTLSVHDTPEKLLLARKIAEMLDRPDSTANPFAVYDVGDGTTVASIVVRYASPARAMRMLMSEIGIRKVASVEEISTVLVRDSAEQVEKAIELIRDFDRQAP